MMLTDSFVDIIGKVGRCSVNRTIVTAILITFGAAHPIIILNLLPDCQAPLSSY